MKRFTDYIQLNEDVLNETPMRTAGAAALILKINSLKNQIIQQRIQPNDNLEHNLERLNTKIDLLAQQNFTIGLLISQINLTK